MVGLFNILVCAGVTEMFKFIGKNLKYPAKPRDNGIMGNVYVGFVVDSTGKVENPIIRAQKLYKMKKKNIFSKPEMEKVESDADLAAECLRLVKSMPEWKPGSINGKLVPVAYTLPLKFLIE